jgi:ribosomal protein L6P/L9E
MKILNITKENRFFSFSGPLGTLTLNLKKLDLSGGYSFKLSNDKSSNIIWKSLKISILDLNHSKEDQKQKFFNKQSPSYFGSIKKFLEKKESSVQLKKNLVVRKKSESQRSSLQSLYAQKFKGISRGFFVYLKIVGIGYRVFLEKESQLTFKLGYSHYYQVNLPKSVKAFLPETTLICLFGIDKNQVTQVAAKIQGIKKPCAYKGKGIRLIDQHIQLKAGKKK